MDDSPINQPEIAPLQEHNSPGYRSSIEDFPPLSISPDIILAEKEGSSSRASHEEEISPEEEEATRTEFYKYVTLYYNYKQQYGNSKEIIKRRIMPDKSDLEKRKEYLKKKPKCVNCGRPVGTIFLTEMRTMLTEDDFRRTLVAKCGDKETPCNFDIQISLPYITSFDDVIGPTMETINRYKSRIIQIKNDVMFGYMKEDDAIKRYTAIGENLADETAVLERTILNRDIASKEHINKKRLMQTEELFEKDVDEFARLTNEFVTTHDEQFLKDSATVYADHILINSKLITNTKYEYCEIEYDDDANMFTLVQKQFPLNNNQNYSGEEVYETIIKFVKGDSLLKFNKTLKTSKISSATIAKNKPKTRKQKNRDTRIKEKLTGPGVPVPATTTVPTPP
jgi:hypothetical protein